MDLTLQEAVDILFDSNIKEKSKFIHKGKMVDFKTYMTATKIVREAVELRIPKKPKYVEGSTAMAMCPSCYSTVYDKYENINQLNICPECGQVIDWK